MDAGCSIIVVIVTYCRYRAVSYCGRHLGIHILLLTLVHVPMHLFMHTGAAERGRWTLEVDVRSTRLGSVPTRTNERTIEQNTDILHTRTTTTTKTSHEETKSHIGKSNLAL